MSTTLSNGIYVISKANYASLANKDSNTQYFIYNMPEFYISNADMALALTTESSLYTAGAVYLCTDAGTYEQYAFYKFNTTEWVKIGQLLSTTILNSLQPKNIVESNTEVAQSDWVSDSTYSGYGYKADISITGVTANDIAEVIFSQTDIATGNLASVCQTGAGIVTIYSKTNSAITIPTIIVIKGGSN